MAFEVSDFELTNNQREYFGLDPIPQHWDRIVLKGDTNHPQSYLYFEGDVIKRRVISTTDQYYEVHYHEQTKNRTVLLPKTQKGKEKKLSASALESRTHGGVYLNVASNGHLLIGNTLTQTTFYSRSWEHSDFMSLKNIPDLIDEFITNSPPSHLKDIGEFKNSKKKHVSFRSGDYFAFRLNRTQFGFGRVLLHIDKIRKKGLVHPEHGLFNIMGPAVLVQLFVYASEKKDVEISQLDSRPKLLSGLMMDNLLFYGEYEIIGHRTLRDEEFDFPISYGRSLDHGKKTVFLQWGLIHKELSTLWFSKYTTAENPFVDKTSPSFEMFNPYGFYSIGFRPTYEGIDVINALRGETRDHYSLEFDLRNPKNDDIRRRILKKFGLDPDASYVENSKSTGTILPGEVNSKLD